VIGIADCQFGDCRLPISNCQLKCNKSLVRLFDYQIGNRQLAIGNHPSRPGDILGLYCTFDGKEDTVAAEEF